MKLLKYLLFFILINNCKQKIQYQNQIKDYLVGRNMIVIMDYIQPGEIFVILNILVQLILIVNNYLERQSFNLFPISLNII